MTREVVTVYANQQMSTAAQVLLDNRITGLPVVTFDGTCVGILSAKDFLMLDAETLEKHQVFQHMSSPVISVEPNDSLLEVAATLRGNRIHRVPVIDDRGHVIGIVSTVDIVDEVFAIIDPDERPSDEVRLVAK
ncbi:MAG: CBS domain-containing protein [Pirellulales bacterium]|nr:CBS domain-containing protein [Pirellulales bacterium]